VALSLIVELGQKNPSLGVGQLGSDASVKKFAFEPLSS
jgi:hypothetical protein